MSERFVEAMLDRGVLQFGDFTLKSGRQSPYFFNLGLINDGPGLAALGAAYASCLERHFQDVDVIFGPAYKGIPLAVATAAALAPKRSVGVAYNRKEAKDHGEGGELVGAALEGRRVVVVDDVMTAGTAVREATDLIAAAGGHLVGVLVALDRQEIARDDRTAVEVVSAELGVEVVAVANLASVMAFLDAAGQHADTLTALRAYQASYCRLDP